MMTNNKYAAVAIYLGVMVSLLLLGGCETGAPSAQKKPPQESSQNRAASVVTELAPVSAAAADSRKTAAPISSPRAIAVTPAPARPSVTAQVWTAAHEKKYRRGRIVASTSCNECHRRYAPHEYSSREWAEVLPTMMQRAKLSRKDREAIRVYLLKASRR